MKKIILKNNKKSNYLLLGSLSIVIFVCLSFFLKSFSAHSQPLNQESRNVLVSIAPYEFLVKKIAGSTVQVSTVVPPGVSAHSFEPTPKQMISSAQADIWFTMGEGFEPKLISTFKSHSPKMEFIDLQDGVDLIEEHHHHHGDDHDHHHHDHGGVDPHIWLSPRQMKIQAKKIADTLIEKYPEIASVLRNRYETLSGELDRLDGIVKDLLKESQGSYVMVSHPAYGYLARDYGFKQLSIEFEGKDPTPKQLTKILKLGKEAKIKTVFVQPQYNSKGAHLIAEKIDADVIMIDPYDTDYIRNIMSIAQHFADATQ